MHAWYSAHVRARPAPRSRASQIPLHHPLRFCHGFAVHSGTAWDTPQARLGGLDECCMHAQPGAGWHCSATRSPNKQLGNPTAHMRWLESRCGRECLQMSEARSCKQHRWVPCRGRAPQCKHGQCRCLQHSLLQYHTMDHVDNDALAFLVAPEVRCCDIPPPALVMAAYNAPPQRHAAIPAERFIVVTRRGGKTLSTRRGKSRIGCTRRRSSARKCFEACSRFQTCVRCWNRKRNRDVAWSLSRMFKLCATLMVSERM